MQIRLDVQKHISYSNDQDLGNESQHFISV